MNVTDNTVNGKCADCGECCGDFLPMLPGEVQRIRAYIKKNGIKEQRHTVPGVSVDLTCPFRSAQSRKCLIYPVRPAICRRFNCSRDYEDRRHARDELHRKGAIVAMRYEFFGNKEDADFLGKLLKSAVVNIKHRRLYHHEKKGINRT